MADAPNLIEWPQAHRIAYQAAAAFRPPYFSGPGFQAHTWVVEAIRSAHMDGQLHAQGKPPIDRGAEMRTRDRTGRIDIEAAARKMAECMGYPWAHMTTEGHEQMRKHAQAVLAAGGLSDG